MRAIVQLYGLCFFFSSLPAFAALTPKEALHLAKHPEAVMVDDKTCELRDAIHIIGTNKLAGPGHYLALFRRRHDVSPFAEGVTLADSTVTIRFEAKPGDRFYSRAYKLDKKKQNIVNAGPIYRYSCVAPGQVEVGDVEQVKQQDVIGKIENTALTDEEKPNE